MARIKIRCLVCFDKFYAPSFNEIPADCPLCGALINQKKMPEVAAPFIQLQGGARTKSIDKVYRDAEAASESRMEQAAAMTPGASKSDFSNLKVTDYRSGMIEGESAVPMPKTSREFNDNINKLQNGGIPVQPNNAIDLSGQVAAFSNQTRVGPEPNAGVRAMDRLRAVHKGNVDPRMRTPISSLPALETQSPNYVPRGAPIIPGVG